MSKNNKLAQANPSALSPATGLSDIFPEVRLQPGVKLEMSYSSGFAECRQYASSGEVSIHRKYAPNQSFQQLTVFNANTMHRDELISLCKALYSDGYTQVRIAQMLGISQATVSNYLRS